MGAAGGLCRVKASINFFLIFLVMNNYKAKNYKKDNHEMEQKKLLFEGVKRPSFKVFC